MSGEKLNNHLGNYEAADANFSQRYKLFGGGGGGVRSAI